MGLSWGSSPEEEEPQRRAFLLGKEALGAVGEKGASVSHITNTRPLHFIPHSCGGGQPRSLSIWETETQVTLNPALFLLIVWTSLCLENAWTFFRGSYISGNKTLWIQTMSLFLGGFPTSSYCGFSLQREAL